MVKLLGCGSTKLVLVGYCVQDYTQKKETSNKIKTSNKIT
jgi:hypothetical protein